MLDQNIFAIGAIISSILVISVTNPVHSVLYLVLAFLNAVILLLILGIELLPLVLIIVYIGAIAILFLFVIMMLNIKQFDNTNEVTSYVPLILIGLVFLWETHPIFNNLSFEVYSWSDINNLANLLYTDYFIYFIIGGLILLVSMLGAIILTISHEKDVKRQDLFDQVTRDCDSLLLVNCMTKLSKNE